MSASNPAQENQNQFKTPLLFWQYWEMDHMQMFTKPDIK